MILNRLITAQGNTLRFHVNHTVNGEPYELQDGEKYYMAIASEDDPDTVLLNCVWNSSDFEMELELDEGIYIFEICLSKNLERQVIIPALDERHRPLNQLIILRRLSS